MRLCCSRTSRGPSHVASDRYWESRAIFVSIRRRCRIRRRSTLLLPILRIVSTRHSGLRSQSPIPTQDIILSQLENPARKIRKDLVLAHEIYPKSAIMFSISVLFQKKTTRFQGTQVGLLIQSHTNCPTALHQSQGVGIQPTNQRAKRKTPTHGHRSPNQCCRVQPGPWVRQHDPLLRFQLVYSDRYFYIAIEMPHQGELLKELDIAGEYKSLHTLAREDWLNDIKQPDGRSLTRNAF
jgi:hypothetical protein